MKSVREQYGIQSIHDLTRRLGRKLLAALVVFGVLSTFSLALGISWLSALFLAICVSSAFFYLYSEDLAVLGYLALGVLPILSLWIAPSTSLLDVSLYSTLPTAITIVLLERIARSEMKRMNLPGIVETIKRGLRFKIYPPAVASSAMLMLFYLGIVIPEYYNLQGVELTKALVMVAAWVLIYLGISIKSVISATLVMYTYFAFGLRMFWSIDALFLSPLFLILAFPIITMRYVRVSSFPVGSRAGDTRRT